MPGATRESPRRRAPRALAALVLSGLALSASIASALPGETRPDEERGCAPLEQGTYPVDVRWQAARSSEGCFFFSGPAALGRDDHLGSRAQLSWRGDRISLAFGRLVFEGRVEGDRVDLERSSDHAYGGTWIVTERIEGRLARAGGEGSSCRVLRARYAYREQPEGGPVGRCTIGAALTVSR